MAYSNVTPPALPAYDSETYGFYLLLFNYELDAEGWYMVQMYYCPWRFRYEEGVGVVGSPNTFLCSYSDGTWSDAIEINGEELALNPGLFGQTYQRIYTNANIFSGNEIWLAENSVTPVEGDKFPIRDFVNGLVMALCGRPIQWPSREPVAYLYGPDKVRLPKLPVVKGFDFAYIGQGLGYFLYLTTAPCKVDSGSTEAFATGAEPGTGLVTYVCRPGGTEWKKQSEGEVSGNYTYWNPFWANYNVFYTDGPLFLQKSGPTPVFE